MSAIRTRGCAAHGAVLTGALVLMLLLATSASAAPLAGSAYDSGDGNQDTQTSADWQSAYAQGQVKISRDRNDDCFIGGVKELSPDGWAFNNSAGGCTPGKSNIRVAYVNPETTAATSFSHFAFFRNDTTGNTFLTFELNQTPTTWVNSKGTTIPCRSNGDILLSFEVGGSSLQSLLYRWTGDNSGPPSCPHGANGGFTGSGVIPGSRSQGTLNSAQAITNYVDPASFGASFPANSFGEAAIDIPAVLAAMGQSPCMAFLQMQVHSRSSSSIASAMIDYTEPVPVNIQSCAAIGQKYADVNANGARDAGESGLGGFDFYDDSNDDGDRDAGEPTGMSDASGFYRILDLAAGSHKIREVAKPGWRISAPVLGFYERTLTSGGNSTGNDFGNVGPATATGTRFQDLDNDGVRDAGEFGQAGWTYYADLDGDGVKDAGEPSAVSDSTGAWTIDTVPAGAFTIREVAQAGWNCSAPAGCAYARTFVSGATVAGLEFGGWTPATVGGNVFEDLDGDGAALEVGDVAQSGWQVYADTNANNVWDLGEIQTTTDGSGNYSLTGVAPGTHTVRVTSPPAGWYCTRPGATASTCERTLTLTSGQLAGGQDFGFSRTATVSGTVFNDADNNGIRGATETAWTTATTIYADLNANGALDAGEPFVSTSTGTWTLSGIPAGTVAIRQASGAFTCTTPAGCAFTLTPTSGQTFSGYEFGNYVTNANGISGTVWLDANANGVKDAAETTGVAGLTVYADNNKNGIFDAGDTTAITNSAGAYALTTTANGSVPVRIKPNSLTPFTAYTCSFPAGCSITVTGLGNGKSFPGTDFGVYGPASASGKLVHDLNANGVIDAGETAGLAGRTIYDDANNNLAFDSATELNTTTAADGGYTLAGLNPGLHRIRMVTVASFTCSSPSGCVQVVTMSSVNVSGLDFLNWTPATITGTVFEDADADGAAREPGEAALAGRTVYLDANNNSVKDGVEPSVVTGVSGIYTFSAVVPGGQTVRQVLPGGWVQDTPAGAYSLVAGSGGTYSARDFSSHTTATISGRVFDDADFQGDPFEAGDSGMAGRTVYLDANANAQLDGSETTAVTDGSGDYTLTVAPGSYSVRTVPANADRACASPSGCAYSITATSGTTYASRDFGSYIGATVSGTVFEDADADAAAREPGEPAAAGRRVYLDANANGVREASEPTTLTLADGTYSFRGMTAQTWTVRLDLTGGWTCDSPSLPCAYTVALTSGATQPGGDFGVHTTATISGHLYTDRDNDGGPQIFGENDQPERTVYLDANANGMLDGAETQTVTDDLGNYSFASLQPGTYRIRQVLPAGWQSSVPAGGLRTVTVVSGETKGAQDFSSWTTAVITGSVFEDMDADGAFPEAGEPGIPLRTVYIDTNTNGSFDGGEPSVLSGAGGSFTFTGLAPATYTVRTVPPDPTWTCSFPASCSVQLVVEAGELAQEINFGLWTNGTLAGTVYSDANGDGDRDAGEGPLAGRIVFVDIDGDTNKGAGEPSQATLADGSYAFGLQPGTYTVRQSPVAGWVCTTSPCSQTATIASGQTAAALDLGSQLNTATVSGTVFDDADADGAAREPGEVARAGRTVYDDLDNNNAADPGEPQTTSAADGSYTLLLVAGVQHALRVEEAGRTISYPFAGLYVFTPTAAQMLPGRDFGSWANATISGRWWDDRDGDGTLGEPGEGGHGPGTVYLDLDGDGARGAGEPTAAAQSDGTFSFPGLRPGAYIVRPDLPADHVCTVCSATVTVASGEAPTGIDVASYKSPTVSGRVVVDANADGAIDAGEPARANVVVYVDADDSGTKDAGEPSATTAADGSYTLTVGPGTGIVRIQNPPGFVCSYPTPCRYSDALLGGDALTGRDFAIHTTATITGAVLKDANADGSGDAPLDGRTVYADLNGDGDLDAGEPFAVTIADGTYSLGPVTPGTRTIRVDLPAGWVCSSPCSRSVTLVSGATTSAVDFALYEPATIAGTVYEDVDGDGTRDPGEPALAGRSVYFDADDNGVADAGEPATMTNGSGDYVLSGVVPDTGTIRGSLPAGYVRSQPATDGYTVTLSSSDALTSRDFGGYRPGSIAGHTADDLNANGIDDPGEPGKAGWTMYLDLDNSGTKDAGEPTATTNGSGDYVFGGLAPRTYRVRPVITAGFTCTKPALCVYVNALVSGENATARDFALVEAAKVSGIVYSDDDADGTRGGSEAGRSGRTVYVDYNDDGTQDPGEPGDATDGSGAYTIVGVSPGSFKVRYATPAGENISQPASSFYSVTFGSGDDVSGRDFGSYVNATISGDVYDDADGSGSRGAGEPGLAGRTVSLDAGADGSVELTTTTDLLGGYAFAGLIPGSYRVTVTVPAGWNCTTTSPCRFDRTVSSGDSSGSADFGLHRIPVADLSLTKSAPATVNQGEKFDYTIVVSNAGPDAAEFVGVRDTLPSGVTFDSVSAGCAYSAPDVSCGLGTIASGGSSTITITVLAVDAGAIANSASVSSETGDPSEGNNGDDADVTVTPVADVQIVKTGSASVAAGGSATYTLTASNNGPSAAHGVVIADTLPTGMTFVSLSAPAGTSCTTPAVGAGGTITCTTATVADGASVVVTLVAKAGFALADTFADNSATVVADEFDSNSANNGDGVSTRVGPASDLRLQKTTSVPALPQGRSLTYTLTATNDGPSDATNVTISDPLPAGVSFVSASAGCTNNAGTVTCDLGTIADGATKTATITVTATANGTQVNTATVTSDNPDPDPSDNPASASVDVGPTADVSIVKTASASVAAGGQLTYTLNVANGGPSSAANVAVTDQLPAGMTHVSSSASQGSCSFASGQVACPLGTLANGASATVTITVQATFALSGTSVPNTATVSSSTNDDDPLDNSSTQVVAVGPAADLVFTKDAPASVPAGGRLLYSLQVTNNGPQTATNAVITDTLPGGLSFVSAVPTKGSCSAAGQVVTCAIGNLADGAGAQVLLTVDVASSLGGQSIHNTAAVASDTTERAPASNTDDATTAAIAPPAPPADDTAPAPAAALEPGNLSVTKTADAGATVALGHAVAFTIRVSNDAVRTAHGVVAIDQPSQGATVDSVRPQKGRCAGLTCSLGDLAPHEVVLVHVVMTPTQAGVFQNAVVVQSGDGERDAADNRGVAGVQVKAMRTTLKLRKTVSRAAVNAGQSVWFTIRATNTGAEAAANVRVCDTPAHNTTFIAARAATFTKGSACWLTATLAPGQSVTFKVHARVTGNARLKVTTMATVTASNASSRQARRSVRVVARAVRALAGVTG